MIMISGITVRHENKTDDIMIGGIAELNWNVQQTKRELVFSTFLAAEKTH